MRHKLRAQRPALTPEQSRQRRAVLAAMMINSCMFLVEITAGVVADSTVLLADAIDMFTDAVALGLSVFVVGRGLQWELRAARIKGYIMLVFGILVLAKVVYQTVNPALPQHQIIEAVALLALFANLWCIRLLARHREANVNMRSLWLCSRNDVIANIAVLVAGLGVWMSQSQWPDLLAGCAIAMLFVATGSQVLREVTAAAANPQGRIRANQVQVAVARERTVRAASEPTVTG